MSSNEPTRTSSRTWPSFVYGPRHSAAYRPPWGRHHSAHYDAGRKLGLGSTQPEEISSNDPTTTSTAVNALHGTVQIWIFKQWKSNLGVPAAESMT